MNKGLTNYLIVALCATGLVFLAGCGGDDDEATTSSTTSTTTPATGTTGATGPGGDVVAQANEICRAANKEAEEIVSTLPADADSAAIIDALAPIYQDILDGISALPGASDDDGIANFLEVAQENLDGLVADPSLLEDDDAFAAGDDAAADAGLPACD